MSASLTGENKQMPALAQAYRKELNEELQSILSYWINNTIDEQNGGFYGSVNNDNIPDRSARKGIVLNSRILWTFSAAYHFTGKQSHLKIAERAFEYIIDHFFDHEYGGVVWSVDAGGKILEGKKQIYGLAFCIYGLSEFYTVTNNGLALHFAKELFYSIENNSFDKQKNGYLEALTREWQAIDDLRLSQKDDNERKTMNTHLHIIEAYSNLYKVWPEELLRERIINLLGLFDKYFINKNNYHLNLFMDDDWKMKSSLESFGHDIEAAWLLLECAVIINDKQYIEVYKKLAVKITDATVEGLDQDGGLWYEYDPAADRLIQEKHSWPQAEAMIGFFNAWQLTGDQKYFRHSVESWEFIKKYIRDDKNGEWLWGVKEDYTAMEKEKAGFWKCPYHNSRACMEIIRRIN
ncbi:MAG: AGE family epimerase/isomerase [Chitinophagaceae bacterium]